MILTQKNGRPYRSDRPRSITATARPVTLDGIEPGSELSFSPMAEDFKTQYPGVPFYSTSNVMDLKRLWDAL
jgi:hypothetical protein